MGRGTLRRAAHVARDAVPVRRPRHGKARRSRAQRRERRRPDPLLRDRRRRRPAPAVAARALHARRSALRRRPRRATERRHRVARRPPPAPGGTRGPLVNALAAAERYYETWGRTWERAALVRARPVAGDPAFGERLLQALAPFIWRRAVDPRVVDEVVAMLARARAEADDETRRGPEDRARRHPRGRVLRAVAAARVGRPRPAHARARTRWTRFGDCAPAAS